MGYRQVDVDISKMAKSTHGLRIQALNIDVPAPGLCCILRGPGDICSLPRCSLRLRMRLSLRAPNSILENCPSDR